MNKLFNKKGSLQALGVFVYCTLVGLFMGYANKIFPNIDLPYGPIIVLLLFSTSALICGAIVFYGPYKLFVAGKKKEAMWVVISTAAWLFVYLLLTFIGLFFFKC